MHAGTAVDANYFKIVSTSRFNVISDRTADRLSYSVDDKCARCYAIDTSTSISELSHAVDNQNLDRHVKNDPNKIDFDDKSKIISITDTDHAKMSISINDKLAAHGCSILRNALSIEVLGVTRKALQPILKNLQQRYDQIADEFEGPVVFLYHRFLHLYAYLLILSYSNPHLQFSLISIFQVLKNILFRRPSE